MRYVTLFLLAFFLVVPGNRESEAGSGFGSGFGGSKQGFLDLFVTIPYVVGNGRNEDEIYQKVMLKKARFFKCYESIRKPVPEIKVKIRFKINPNGLVSDLKVVESTAQKNLVFPACVRNVFKLLTFEPIDGEFGDAVVEQAIIFRIIDA